MGMKLYALGPPNKQWEKMSTSTTRQINEAQHSQSAVKTEQ